MACKDNIHMPRGRGWSGIIAAGPAPSWDRDERHEIARRAFYHLERERKRLARASRPRAKDTAKVGARTDGKAQDWATEGDRDLFDSIAAGRPIPRVMYMLRPLWRNRSVIRALAASGKAWARPLVMLIPDSAPR